LFLDLVFFEDFALISATAKKLKEKEIIIAKHFSNEKEIAELKKKAGKEKLKIFFCHVLQGNDEKAAKQFKQLVDFVGVFGGNIAANKFAISNRQVDFLFQPVGKERFEFDSALANCARDNNVAVVALFSDFLNASQYDLVSLFRNWFLLQKVCAQANAELKIFSGAKSIVEMRSSQDLESFIALLKQKSV
jgi:RNase P/RNase MRP subunit p30